MKHEIKQQTKTEVEFLIALDEKYLTGVKAEILARLKQSLKVDGFRPGKMPDSIAERNIDSTKLQMEVVEAALSRSYGKIIKSTKLDVLSSPKVEVTKFVPFTALEYSAKAALVPKIDFDYSKLNVKFDSPKVDKDEVDKTVISLQNQMAKRTKVSRAAKNGDEVMFDFEGVLDGQPVEGAAAKNHLLRLGEGQFIPGFEDNLVGLKKEDEKKFKVTFPKDYGKDDLAGKEVEFSVKMGEVTEIDLPKIDDKFAQEVGQFESVEKLRDDIELKLIDAGAKQAEKDYEDKVVAELIKKMKLEVSDILIDEQVHSLTHEVEDQLKSSGLSLDQYAAMSGKKEDDFKAEIRTEAQKRVTLGLVIRDIITRQNFTVDDMAVQNEITNLRAKYTDPKMLEELDHDHFKSDVATHLLSRQALSWLVDQAKGGR